MPVLLVAAGMVVAAMRPAASAADGFPSTPWKLKAIELADGRRLEGLFESEENDAAATVSFTEVVRRPGRGMYLVLRSNLGADRIKSVERLPAGERSDLAKRVRDFRDRGGVQGRAREAVKLSVGEADGLRHYRGEWFSLASSASDAITREAVVRLEQLFTAFESLVPSNGRADAAALSVRLCGTDAEYRGVQQDIGAAVENPALYDATRRLLVAGSDFPVLAEEHATADESLAALELAARDRDAALDGVLREVAARLERQGVPAPKRADAIRLARARHDREKAAELDRIATARRENRRAMEAARRVFYGRLAHEAWHAHAHGLAGGRAAATLPAWLDEGLAQIFETAPLEDGELRLDAPDPARLEAMQRWLASTSPGRLREIVSLGDAAFMVGHASDREVSREAYLTAWAMALHVALLEPVLDRAAVRRLAGDAKSADPLRQFESAVGMPVDRFEASWRRRIAGLEPTAAVTSPPAGGPADR